ncbi:MAG: endolytic transglycosylase MltG [Chloroflexi bacterium]|nr:endolytic transglycosylase MltG [Chloroflexota bacterium]
MRAVRIFLRIVSLVVGISAVVIVLSTALVYLLRDAETCSPKQGYVVTTNTIERSILWVYLQMHRDEIDVPADAEDATVTEFTVDEGESLNSVSMRLRYNGLINNADLFRRYVQYHGSDVGIQAGSFALRRDMTIQQIMKELQFGQKLSFSVTIVEGLRAEEIGALLEASGICSAQEFVSIVLQGRVPADFIGERPEGGSTSLEGFLYPDTYELIKNSPADDVVLKLLDNWDRRVPSELRDQAGSNGLTLYQTVILASIIEREAVVADEMPTIASVYINRLRQSMHLQADPTVQYAKGLQVGTWWPPLTTEDLQSVQSTYNTYVHFGLPPGPICNPGIDALQAALNPESTDYIYFVAKGDGTHAFATTFEEHLANIQQYAGQ